MNNDCVQLAITLFSEWKTMFGWRIPRVW